MIDALALRSDLIRQLKKLEDDLRARVKEAPELDATLRAEWQAARDADRTAETFESWAEQVYTQAGVHWLLSCVFLRFIEDNGLVERPWLAGTPASGRLALARDRHEAYFRAHPTENDRDYLLAAFREAGALPGLSTFFDEAHNPVFRLGISGDAAMALHRFWQHVDANTGALAHDFTDVAWNTRFLGDLYEHLSEATRKRYALLQTPEFVEEFILDRTLTPAIREFGLREVRMIDPTCGSGHFLLGGFHRLVDAWARAEPGRNRRDVAQKALDAVAGVDLNPFAVAIARFRLLLAALKVGEVQRLTDAPNFKLHVAIGDSLLHGRRFGELDLEGEEQAAARHGYAHAYASEDLAEVRQILGRQYHAVVGNPPYIVVKDAALNAAYRHRYASCHRQYSLGAPFTERIFELALTGQGQGNGQPAGFVGLITANSFMKREFGSKLIEQVLPRLDLTHMVDTSGAYIPGHGTPTVILFGRHRAPVGDMVRTVMGIKGEPATPEDPARGLVWLAIVEQIDRAGSDSEFVSVADTPRTTFSKHPWSIGGGGAAGLRDEIEERATSKLNSVASDLGFGVVTREDDAYMLGGGALRRLGVAPELTLLAVDGENVREWGLVGTTQALWPYAVGSLEPCSTPLVNRVLWSYRTGLSGRVAYGKSQLERGLDWFEYSMFFRSRFASPLTITYAEIATHNHFVLDHGGKVFKQTAPVIKLPAGSGENEHLGLLGLLNSSVACFWLKQVCHNKGEGGGTRVEAGNSALGDEAWKSHFAFNSTKVSELPLAADRPVPLARALDQLSRQRTALGPQALLRTAQEAGTPLPGRIALDASRAEHARLLRRMVALQEALDWRCYHLYGLTDKSLDNAEIEQGTAGVEVHLGERAFEIVLARRVAVGRETTTWFARHGSTPITEIPSHWPEAYRVLVQRRIDLIESDRNIALIERPEYKRRWNMPAWDELERAALRDWLLERLEDRALWPASDDRPPQLTTTGRLADALRLDADFLQIAELYAGHAGFDLGQLVADLVAGQSVPFLPALRYTDSGLRKRAQWEDTWALQRREDAGDAIGTIPVPPKYKKEDFKKTSFWDLRGGLDVPKERWVSYPGCERGTDSSLVIAWAGWNHLQQATALAAYYLDMKDNEGWPRERLLPLLAGLLELVPWLKQWHNELDPNFGERMGDFYAGFVVDQARELGSTEADLRTWQPPTTAAPRGRRRRTAEA